MLGFDELRAQRFKRVFGIDIQTCPASGEAVAHGRLRRGSGRGAGLS
jgi:hypothetical protein